MSEREVKGLCYFCNEKYMPEHYLKHKKTPLFLMETKEEEMEAFEEFVENEELDEGDITRISVNAMRVKGKHEKRIHEKRAYLLIDSGSTHNFMNPSIAKKASATLHPAGSIRVVVADGRKLDVVVKIANFEWLFQGTKRRGERGSSCLKPLEL